MKRTHNGMNWLCRPSYIKMAIKCKPIYMNKGKTSQKPNTEVFSQKSFTVLIFEKMIILEVSMMGTINLAL